MDRIIREDDVIHALKKLYDNRPLDSDRSVILACKDEIIKLPSAQPRKGKWIYLTGLDAFECSVCGRQMVRNIFDYCPWCGAEMKGEEDE